MQEWIAVAALVVAAASFASNFYNNKTSGVWDLSDRLNALDRDRDKQRQIMYKHIEDKFDEAVNLFGETVKSTTEHVRQLELDLYKHFIREPHFIITIETLNKNINDRFDRLEKRLDKVEI